MSKMIEGPFAAVNSIHSRFHFHLLAWIAPGRRGLDISLGVYDMGASRQ